MIKRILVALSGTPFTPSAIRHATELAREHEAEVTGVTVVDPERLADVGPVPLGGGAAAHTLAEHRLKTTQEHIETQIAGFEAECKEAGIRHRVIRETGDALDELTACWRYHDLTVFGLRGLFEYGVVDNPDDLLIRLIARGVRPILAVAETHRPIRRVLMAYNGSMESATAMKRFVQMRLWPSTKLKVVTFDMPGDEADALLADAADYCRAHGEDVETEHLPGHPRDDLLPHAAAWNADLIVMGSTARSRLAQKLLGDTATKAIKESEVPLFLAQ